MRAFVTGASGFIGRRLAERLHEAGHGVTALLRKKPHGLPAWVSAVQGSLEDSPDNLAKAMAGHDVVYHLAAQVSFDPRKLPALLRTNGDGTRSILIAARKAAVGRTVLVSSACTIGLSHHPEDVLDEEAPFDPRLSQVNPYLHSKRLAEACAAEAAGLGQWVTTVNPTTVFGPGDHSLNSGTLIQRVARSRLMPVPPGGSNVVDVDDVVEGMLAAADHGQPGRRYILGGANLTFREIIHSIAEAVGRRPHLVPMPMPARRPLMAAAWMMQRATSHGLITPQIIGDTFAYKFYSSRLAETELGWRAKRDFASTLSAAWEYYRREGLIAPPAREVA